MMRRGGPSMILPTTIRGRTTQAFATFVRIDLPAGHLDWSSWSLSFPRTRLRKMKSAGTSIEALMIGLRAASAELATSATVGTSRMVLRFKLSNAIRDAEKTERAAEALRAAASAAISGDEQRSVVPDPTGDIEMESADR